MEFKTLQELCTEIIDCPHTTPEWKTEGIPVIRNYNLQNGFIDKSKLSFVDNDTYLQRIKRGMPQVDDIIFSREAPVGSVAIMPSNFRCCLGQRLVLLKVNKSICDPHYLLYVMLSNFVKKQYKTVEKTGSIVSNFNIGDLKNLVIPYVDIAIQKKIGKMCGMLDRKIAVNNLTIENLESMAKTLYDYWFVQFDFPDANGNPYKTSGGKMEWNETLSREIPAGWGITTLEKYFEIGNGKDHSQLENGIYPVYGSGGLMRRVNKFLFNEESVLIPRKGTLNNVMHVCGAFWTVDTMYYTKMKRVNTANYVYQTVNLFNFEKLNTGSALPSMTASIIYSLKVPDAPASLIDKYENYASEFFTKIQLLEEENRKLCSLRDFLLPMLMNGQVTFRQ